MTCHRLLGLEYEFSRGGYLGINNHGKNVLVRVSHVGLQHTYFDHLFKSSSFKKFHTSIKQQIQSIMYQFEAPPIIISSIDSLHPITGIKNKLLSYYQFLRKYRETYNRKVMLIQFCLPILDNNESAISQVKIIANTRREIKEIVAKIQREFGSQSVVLQEENASLEKRLALWAESDVLLVSSLRDGLCLPLYEYVAAKKHTGNIN
jgi:trehalose-6-phosphate synthase